MSRLEHLFVLKTLSHTQQATKSQKLVGFSLKLLCCRDPVLPALYGYLQSAILLGGKRTSTLFDHASCFLACRYRLLLATIAKMQSCSASNSSKDRVDTPPAKQQSIYSSVTSIYMYMSALIL